jgi:hypothetical protein
MLIRALKVRRRAFLAAGAFAAATLAGCQSGQQFARPGVAHGDTGPAANSPAFAQIEKGQNLAGGRMSAPMTNGMAATSPGMTMPQYQMAAGQPMMGSGGMVQPIAYSSAGPMPMQSMPMQSMPMQTMQMQTMPMMQPQMMYQQQTMPTVAAQPTYMVVNGPNGPQYMLVPPEMMASMTPATAPTTPMMPMMPMMTTMVGTPAPTMSAVVPVANPTPTMIPAAPPTGTIAAPEPMPSPPPAPTFTAPPMTSVPLPAMPALPTPADATPKIPDPLPKSVSAKPPTGPALPTPEPAGPSLGSFQSAPTISGPPAVKLPPARNAIDDDIPPAPSFLPPSR